ERRVFNLEYRVKISFGHAAKRYCVTQLRSSDAPSAYAWPAKRRPCAEARTSTVQDPAAPRPNPGLRPGVQACRIRRQLHQQNVSQEVRSATDMCKAPLLYGHTESPARNP